MEQLDKKALIVIDMQNDFVCGALGTKEAEDIVPKIKDRILAARKEKYDLIFTRDTHDSNYLQTQEGKYLPIVHCLSESWGWQILPEISINEAKIFNKSTFGSMELANYVRERNYSSVELVGVCTDICVLTNAILIKTICPELNVKVRGSCCAGVTPERHAVALIAMQACQVELCD